MDTTQLDQQLGSLIEAWYTRDVPDGHCQFCNEEIDDVDAAPSEGVHDYCSEQCREGAQTVQDARLALGQRDLRQRGYD